MTLNKNRGSTDGCCCPSSILSQTSNAAVTNFFPTAGEAMGVSPSRCAPDREFVQFGAKDSRSLPIARGTGSRPGGSLMSQRTQVDPCCRRAAKSKAIGPAERRQIASARLPRSRDLQESKGGIESRVNTRFQLQVSRYRGEVWSSALTILLRFGGSLLNCYCIPHRACLPSSER